MIYLCQVLLRIKVFVSSNTILLMLTNIYFNVMENCYVAIWAFVAGGLYGVVAYVLFGFVLDFGARLLGSVGGFRRERQIVGFALAPLALSLLVLFPVRLALYGGDTFRDGGPDEGTGEAVLLALQLGFAAWSLALLVIGIRVVHGWTWLRTLAAFAAAVALLGAIVGVFALI